MTRLSAAGSPPARRLGLSATVAVALATLVGACGSGPVTPVGPISIAGPATSPATAPQPGVANVVPSGPTTAEPGVLPPAPAAQARSRNHGTRRALDVPILMYHLIGGQDDPGALRGLVVPDALFAAQLRTLAAAGWRTIALSVLANDLLNGVAPPPRSFAITFDDGHQDGFTQALPILLKLGDTATYFVITSRIGRPGYLYGPELRQLAADGMGIGNHTVHHLDVAALPERRAIAEIDRAQATLTQILGTPPRLFAYPAGEASLPVEADVAAAGIQLAVGNQEGVGESMQDRFLVPRIRVSPSVGPAELLRMLDWTVGAGSTGGRASGASIPALAASAISRLRSPGTPRRVPAF